MPHRHLYAVCRIGLVLTAVLALATPAHAAFPGRNGKIAVSFFDDPGGGVGPARSGIALLRADRGISQERAEVVACTDDRRPPHECLRDYASPAFSPNGRWIAFDAGRRIAVVRTNGTGRRLLAAAGTDSGSPAWSPDGKRIVFDAARSTAPRAIRDVYTVAADGSGRAKRVVRDAADPSRSVDGLFAFERPSNAIPPHRRRIWVSRPAGGGDERRAAAGLVAERPQAGVVVVRHLRRPSRRDPCAQDREGPHWPHGLVQLLDLPAQLAAALSR
jgi:WD40-like Beta Propeller Repeat